ncbi:MAG: lipocalin family protein [Bacteroidota bacterium]
MKKYLFSVILISLLAACQDDSQSKQLILGQWKVDKWLVGEERTEKQSLDASFDFRPDGSYEVDYTTQKEVGTYRIAGRKLYTTENGQMEKMVKIIKLTSDSLEFEMNRAGQFEVLILKKQS